MRAITTPSLRFDVSVLIVGTNTCARRRSDVYVDQGDGRPKDCRSALCSKGHPEWHRSQAGLRLRTCELMNPDRPKVQESMISGLVLDMREGSFSRFRMGRAEARSRRRPEGEIKRFPGGGQRTGTLHPLATIFSAFMFGR